MGRPQDDEHFAPFYVTPKSVGKVAEMAGWNVTETDGIITVSEPALGWSHQYYAADPFLVTDQVGSITPIWKEAPDLWIGRKRAALATFWTVTLLTICVGIGLLTVGSGWVFVAGVTVTAIGVVAALLKAAPLEIPGLGLALIVEFLFDW